MKVVRGQCADQHKQCNGNLPDAYELVSNDHPNQQNSIILEAISQLRDRTIRLVSGFAKFSPRFNQRCNASDQASNAEKYNAKYTNDRRNIKDNLNFRHDESLLSHKEVMSGTCGRDWYSLSHTYVSNNIISCLAKGFILFAFVLLSVPAMSAQHGYSATVVYVIDGDTFKAKVALPGGSSLKTNVRIAHIDTPEKKRGAECEAEVRAGYAATAYAKKYLLPGQSVILRNVRQGKYRGRVIAEVTLNDGRDFGTIMLQSGYAIPYEGGWKRKVWC